MNDVTVVVLAAGLGTRMRSTKAKVLHEAGGDTLLNHVLRAAAAVTTPDRIVVVVGHQANQVKATVRLAGVRFAEQTVQEGTGHALLCAREAAERNSGALLILNGDGPLLKASTLQAVLAAQGSGRTGDHIVTTEVEDPTGYGRIVRSADGDISAIVEQKAANEEQKKIREINTGVYLFDAKPFWKHLGEIEPNAITGEYYLTDIVELLRRNGHSVRPFLVRDETELLGINTRTELAVADAILRRRKNEQLMLSGVTIEAPHTVLIDVDVEVGVDSTVGANVQLRGKTRVGKDCTIGAGSILRDCEIGEGVTVLPYVVAQDTRIGNGAHVGPFARLRQKADAGEGVHIGNFVELKNTTMAKGAKANHLAYLGDAAIGPGSNIGAGSITCNYDGVNKHRTEIGECVFIGSNSTLVAPLSVGSGAYVAAGSVITKNVDPDALAIGREQQVDKRGWAKARRERLKKQ